METWAWARGQFAHHRMHPARHMALACQWHCASTNPHLILNRSRTQAGYFCGLVSWLTWVLLLASGWIWESPLDSLWDFLLEFCCPSPGPFSVSFWPREAHLCRPAQLPKGDLGLGYNIDLGTSELNTIRSSIRHAEFAHLGRSI